MASLPNILSDFHSGTCLLAQTARTVPDLGLKMAVGSEQAYEEWECFFALLWALLFIFLKVAIDSYLIYFI